MSGPTEDNRHGGATPAPPSPHQPAPTRDHRRLWVALLLGAFLLFAMSLRSPITVIAPLVGRIGEDLHVGAALLGSLTSIPVLCFGLLTPLASLWLRAVGVNTGALSALVLIVTGSVVRSSGTIPALFIGTLAIGVGITIGNLAAPMVIGREFRSRAALVTGMYSAFINIVVTASTALAVPIADGIGWRLSAQFWGLFPALPAVALWLWVFPPRAGGPRPALAARAGRRPLDTGVVTTSVPHASSMARWPVAWVMTGVFACQSFCYYGVSSWLPSALGDLAGMSEAEAGVAASLFQLIGIVGPLVVPVLFGTLHWSRARVMALVTGGWMCLPFGLVLLPAAWPLWCTISGFTQGATFTALFTIVIERTRSVDENRQLSAMIQTGGYLVAATSPILIGQIHESTGTWVWPFLTIGLATVTMAVCGQIVARDTSTPPTSRRALRSGAGA